MPTPPLPHLSVLIPTFRRSDKLAACVRALAAQTLPPDHFEVLIGLDGPDPASEDAARQAWRAGGGGGGAGAPNLVLLTCPREGYTRVRNRLLAQARARTLISLNDDVIPDPDFLRVHLAEQRAAEAAARPAIIVGHSPFKPRPSPTLLDRLVAETGMVFFYDVMNTPSALAGRDRDWGFRHCFGLNFSAPLDMVRQVGGFLALPHVYGYDDIELAFKLQQRFHTPVLYRPEALAPHDHAYRANDLIERERSLGTAAWHFARANPAFGRAVFGRDIASESELEYSREFLRRERAAAERLREQFLQLDQIPGDAVPHDVLPLIASHWLLLKRWEWRRALLEASETSPAHPASPAPPHPHLAAGALPR